MNHRSKTAAATLVPVALVGIVAWGFGWATAAVIIMIVIAIGTLAVLVMIDA